MKQKLIRILAGFLTAMLLFTFLSRAADNMSIARVNVQKADRGKVTHQVSGSGKVQSNREQAVSTLPGQTIQTIYVDEGQQVAAGDLLFEVDLESLREQILEKKQEMKKQELLAGDSASSREAKAYQEQMQKDRAAQDYNVAAGKGNTAISRAWQDLQNAKKKLQTLSSGAAQGDVGDAVQQVLQQACDDKKLEYEQALQYQGEIEQAIEDSVQRALAGCTQGAGDTARLVTSERSYMGTAPEAQNPLQNAASDAQSPLQDAASGAQSPLQDAAPAVKSEAAAALQPAADVLAENMQGAEEMLDQPTGVAAGTLDASLADAAETFDMPPADTARTMDMPSADTAETLAPSPMNTAEVSDTPPVDEPEIFNTPPADEAETFDTLSVVGTETLDTPSANTAETFDSASMDIQEEPDDILEESDDILEEPDIAAAQTETEAPAAVPGSADDELILGDDPPAYTEDPYLVEQRIRQENQPLLDSAKELVRTKEEEYNQAKEALDAYLAEKTAGGQTNVEAMKAQIQEEIRIKQQAYDDAVTAANDSLRSAGRAVEDASAPQGSDSTGEIDAITREQAELQLAKLERLLKEQGKVLSPIDGTVVQINITTGEKSPDGTAVLLTDKASGSRLVVQVSETLDKYIARGDAAVVQSVNGKEKREDLTVESVRASEEDKTLLDVTVQLPEGFLESGVSATMKSVRDSQSYSCRIPIQALYEENGRQFVYIIAETQSVLGTELTAQRLDVTVLDKNETYAALQQGTLASDARVIVSSDKTISDGSRVRIND